MTTDTPSDTPTETLSQKSGAPTRKNGFGVAAMALAAIALLASVIHLSAGPFAPQKSAEQTIAETAVGIKEAAKRAITGEAAPPPVEQPRHDIDEILQVAVLIGAGLAMALALVALVRQEQQRPAFAGFTLGTGVILMTFVTWLALLICAAVLLYAIIDNLGDILSF